MDENREILIAGATPAGLQAALSLGACGRKVTVAAKGAAIGPPPAGWSDRDRRWYQYLFAQVAYHPLITLLTETEVAGIKADDRRVRVELTQKPRWVRPDLCTDCRKCLQVCPVRLPDGTQPIFSLNAPRAVAIEKREKAACRPACPLDMNPQAYVALIAQSRFEEAYELIRDQNPLPGICGRVCHHPCEKQCRRQEVDEPVRICALKRFAAEAAKKQQGRRNRVQGPRGDGRRVAIIGAGPAGLTAAHDLAKAGWHPTLIEGADKPGGLLWQGIGPYRLPREVIEEEIQQILNLGVDLRLRSPAGSWKDIEALKQDGFDFVLLTIGASKDLRLNIKGEDLAGIHGCVSFLRDLWHGRPPGNLGKVVVIGGGNAAVEAARAALRFGARSVTVLYRRTRREMPADPHEVELAAEEGVRFSFLQVPTRFEGPDGHLARIRCMRMKPGPKDASGRRRPVPVANSEFSIPAATAIVSIGQKADPPQAIDERTELGPGGALQVAESGKTSIPWLYAAGDAASGPSTVVEAMASGRRAAYALMAGREAAGINQPEEEPESKRAPYDPVPKGTPKQNREPLAHRAAGERVGDTREVIGDLTAEAAVREASRCLQCGVCSECLLCEAACELGAIRHAGSRSRKSFDFDEVILADDSPFAADQQSCRIRKTAHYGRQTSRAKAGIAGRAAAMAALAGTPPANIQSGRRVALDAGAPRTGIFICSCNGALNAGDRLERMVSRVATFAGIAHAEVVNSACHPDQGRRIEELIQKAQLNGALIGACACCHLDFACEACTDQRMRLKNRLFRESGYDRQDIALVNLKETCWLPLADDPGHAIEHAVRTVQAGLELLSEQKVRSRRNFSSDQQVIVLGATEAGIAAARGLRGQYRKVVLIERNRPDAGVRNELEQNGIELVSPVGAVRLQGRAGEFTVLVEERPGPGKRAGAKKNASIEAQHRRLRGSIVILGDKNWSNLPYAGDAFASGRRRRSRRAFGTLETSIPGVFRASWTQASTIPAQVMGAAAAVEALEGATADFSGNEYLFAEVDRELCRGCGLCADVCPEGAVRLEESSRGMAAAWIASELCSGCGNCLAECPTGAVSLPEAQQGYYEKVVNAFLG